MNQLRHVGTFSATDSDRGVWLIHVYQGYGPGLRGQIGEPTHKVLRLGDGTLVNRIQKGTYLVVDGSERVLTSQDLHAE